MPYFKEAYKDLRKPNGMELKSDPRKAMRGTLNALKQVFTKDIYGKFMLTDQKEVDKYLNELKAKYEKLRLETSRFEKRDIPEYNENCYVDPAL